MLNGGVTWAVLGVCLGVWAVIGFFLWIPRLLRAMFLFLTALVQVTVTDSTGEDAARRLRRAAEFYTRGFSRAVEGIRLAAKPSESDADGPTGEGWQIEPRLIFGELAWALAVWYVVLWFLGVSVITPLDLISWLAEVSWSETWSSIVGAVQAIPLWLGGGASG